MSFDVGTPDSWAKISLGQVVTILRGVSYDKADAINHERDGYVPILRATNIDDGTLSLDDLVYVPARYVSQGQYLQPGDLVLAASSGSLKAIGKAAPLLHSWQGSFGAFCFALRPLRKVVNPRFLTLFFQTRAYRATVSRLAAGININNLKSKDLNDLAFPLPPSEEQERIATEAEQQLSRLDSASATLGRIQANLQRYQASVLKAACEGRLVPTAAELARAEGGSYEHAGQLLARILEERRRRCEAEHLAELRAKGKEPRDDSWKLKYQEPAPPDTAGLPELPEGWCWASVEQLNPPARPCAYGVLQPGDEVPDGTRLVRVGDIENGKINIDQLRRIEPEIASRYPRTLLHGGEVLLTLVGTIGRTAVVPASLVGANTARAVGVVPLSDLVSAQWIEIWLRSPAVRARITSKAHEVARKTLNLEDVRTAAIGLPPIAEQQRIVQEVERRLAYVDSAELTVEHSKSHSRGLRQALLKAAFEGKLVPQDPNDEPASVLLERIAEHEKDARPAGRRRRARVVEEPEAPAQLPLPSPAPAPEPVPSRSTPPFLDLPFAERRTLVREALAGFGALDRDEAVRRAAEALRDQGLAPFQRLRRDSALYEAIDEAIAAGLRAGAFDRPRRGTVRAVWPEARDYTLAAWRRCLFAVLDGAPADIEETFRAAAEWARDNVGLQYVRLLREGIIVEGLRAALLEAERRGKVERVGKNQIRRRE